MYLYLSYEGTSATTHTHTGDQQALKAWRRWALTNSSAEAKLYRLPKRKGNATLLATCADGEVSRTEVN